MRARAFYLAVVAPFVVWLVINPLLSSWLAWMADSGQTATFVERVVILGFVWTQRMVAPAAIVAMAIAAPLLTLAAAWRLRLTPAHRAHGVRTVLAWLGLFVVSWLAGLGFADAKLPSLDLFVVFIWSAFAADAIVVAIAYRTRESLNAEGLSRIAARDVLWLAIVLQLLWVWPGFLAGAIPLVASLRARKGRPT